uniref:Uncharacterized protein n=1 Tax=Oryza nivara TaxID=4536 RepID=A0A0E0I3T6_ORYNI
MEKRRGNSGFFQDRHWGRLGLVLGRLQQTDAAGRLPSTDQNAAGAGKTEGLHHSQLLPPLLLPEAGGIPTGAISPTSTSPPPLHPSSPSVHPPSSFSAAAGSGASPRRAVAAESVVLGGGAVLPPPTMLRRCVPSRPRRLPLPDDHPLVAVFSFLFIPT